MKSGKLTVKQRGVSFPELVFAMALVALVLVTMIGTLISGLEALQKGTSYNQANIIAQRVVESYRKLDYDEIAIASDVTSEEGFVVETNVTKATYGSSQEYKKLTIKVSKAGDIGSTTINNKASKRVNVVMEAVFINY